MIKRLNKYISETGYCSRREADKLIEEGQVTVNGLVATTGLQVNEDTVVRVRGEILSPKQPPVYMAFNKPCGITSTTDRKDPDNIIDCIGYDQRIFPIGRLDKASEGLIFLTNDGDIVNKILRAGNEHEKEYVVTVNHKITDEFLKKMSQGVRILGQKTKPCKVTIINHRTFNIVLTQGLNRQIRRMCDVLGYEVVSLKRVRIMNVQLGQLKVGHWRYLTEKEIAFILKAVKTSVKTEEASLPQKKGHQPKKVPSRRTSMSKPTAKGPSKYKHSTKGPSKTKPTSRSTTQGKRS